MGLTQRFIMWFPGLYTYSKDMYSQSSRTKIRYSLQFSTVSIYLLFLHFLMSWPLQIILFMVMTRFTFEGESGEEVILWMLTVMIYIFVYIYMKYWYHQYCRGCVLNIHSSKPYSYLLSYFSECLTLG